MSSYEAEFTEERQWNNKEIQEKSQKSYGHHVSRGDSGRVRIF